MKGLKFTKMHGLGNDFMVIDAVTQPVNVGALPIRALSQRDTGIGFDQCLLIEPSKTTDTDFFYRIINANGQEVGQCGNGARCIARFIQSQGLSNKRVITVSTFKTRMALTLHDDNEVTVTMGQPTFEPKTIPFTANEAPLYWLPLEGNATCPIQVVHVGNPHAVTLVDQIAKAPVLTIGQAISEHPWFPEQTNAGFMQINSPSHIDLRVYERGCGETRACGSGAVAAVAIGHHYHGLDNHVTVRLPGGELTVFWPSFNEPIELKGPATFVYDGVLRL